MKIAVLAGDGSAPEFMRAALQVLEAVRIRFKLDLSLEEGLVGGAACDRHGHPLPQETLDLCDRADAILFGSVGRDDLPQGLVEVEALLALRKHYQFFANLRPATVYAELAEASSLKRERLADESGNCGFDILTVRELIGGAYFGEKVKAADTGYTRASDNMAYSRPEIERIVKVGFEAARKRGKRLTSVDKANVLESSRLWRRVVEEMKPAYPDIAVTHLYVDNAAMQLATWPRQFDVIVTENLFGDILSDLSAAITGSLGLLPSASLNERGFGMYEPSGGTAPDIAGYGIANPIAQIRSAAMMLEYSFGLSEAAAAIEKAVKTVLGKGGRTIDISGNAKAMQAIKKAIAGKNHPAVQAVLDGEGILSTEGMAKAVISALS